MLLLFASSMIRCCFLCAVQSKTCANRISAQGYEIIVEKSRITSSKHGEDCCLLQRSVTKRAVDMSTGVGASSHAPHRSRRWGSHEISSVTQAHEQRSVFQISPSEYFAR